MKYDIQIAQFLSLQFNVRPYAKYLLGAKYLAWLWIEREVK